MLEQSLYKDKGITHIKKFNIVNQGNIKRTIVRCRFISTRMATFKTTDKPEASKDVEHTTSRTRLVQCEAVEPLWRTVWPVMPKINTHEPASHSEK